MDDKQDQLEELLVDWEQQRRQGSELTGEELCTGNPELAPELAQMISQLKEMDWLEDSNDSDADFLHLPDFSTVSGQADETRLPKCDLSLAEFFQRLIESELMDEGKIEQLRTQVAAEDAWSFASQLVSDKKLTRFQATVLLEGQDIPLVLDRYVLLGEIGKGGMGAVYKALHQQLDRVVALKILPKEAVDSPEKVKRFQREAKAAAKLEHANIVTTHDARDDKGYHFLVMSLVNGSDLADLVRQQGPVSCAKAVDYIAQAARGLDHAHRMGIVHRDIKPGNLLLSKTGKVKILDMGLARIENGDPEHENTTSTELTQVGMVMGTIAYLAPEQALDTRNADARSDIYSLGCTLYYLLTGKVIFCEDTMMKTIMAHREGEIPSLCDKREDVPAELDTIFQKMVAKKSDDRFQSMAEVISALGELDIEDEQEAPPIVTGTQANHDTATFIDTSREVMEPAARYSKPSNRRWPLIAAGMLGLVVVLAGLIITLQTPAGTIILEIDQPEIVGAQVLIDGNKSITIKTGKGTEAIQVKPDKERHKLEVQLAGFKTFTETFTYDNGNNKKIKVTLVPLPVVAGKGEPVLSSSREGEADDRKVAEWVISHRGFVSGKTQTTKFIGSNHPEKLPSVPFQITAITVADQSITDEDVKQLAALSALEVLSLTAGVTDEGLAHLARIRSLKSLGVNTEKQLTDRGMVALQDLPNLEALYLNCDHHSISEQGIETIAKLTRLKILHIQLSPGLIEGSKIGSLENLKRLEIGGGIRIDEQFTKALSKCQQLDRLALTDVPEEAVEHLTQLSKLRSLELSGPSTKITDSAVNQLKNLRGLRWLTLADLPITDGCIESLAELKKLEKLTILKTKITPEGMAELQAALPNCEIEHDFTEGKIEAEKK